MTTEERIENLERKLIHAERCDRWHWMVTVVVWMIVGFGLASVWPTKEIRCSGLTIEDKNGKVQAKLAADWDGPSLKLYDENDNIRVMLDVDKDGPSLMVMGANDGTFAGLSTKKGEASLYAHGPGGSSISLSASETKESLAILNGHKLAAQLVVSDSERWLKLYDENQNTRLVLGAANTVRPDGTQIQHPESSLFLFGPDGKAVWSAP